ncbi:MAG: hypothetical protein MI757_09480 [Pirellulales bacterium]|nr:hypothetical protein [Pirellulales bacterium]
MILITTALLVGCGEDEPEPAEPPPVAKPAPKPPPKEPVKPPKPKEPAPVEPTIVEGIKASLGEPFETEKCAATLGLGVLQIRNYDPAEPNKFPAVLLWMKTEAEGVEALKGSTLAAHAFVQKTAEAPPLYDTSGNVKVKITDVQDTLILGEVVGATLVDIDSGQPVAFECEFVAKTN